MGLQVTKSTRLGTSFMKVSPCLADAGVGGLCSASAGISAIPKSAAALLPNRTEAYTGDEQHYIVELDVFHQLHCLVRFPTEIGDSADLFCNQNLIRKSIWPEHYPEVQEARYTPLEGGGAFDHVDHCLNAIRESLT